MFCFHLVIITQAFTILLAKGLTIVLAFSQKKNI